MLHVLQKALLKNSSALHAMMVVAAVFALVLWVLLAMHLWRRLDQRDDARERSRLIAFQPDTPLRFEPSILDGLPAAAQRYFKFSIALDTPLYTVADISMRGQFSLGTKSAPRYLSMTAEQTLAAPNGFVWTMRAARGAMHVSGSDSGRWTRFWLWNLIPVARLGGDADHRLSAFGRYVAEALFWTPAALLPGPTVQWQAIDDNRARVCITHDGLQQDVELVVDEAGRPTQVSFQRWSDANPQRKFRRQAFGGDLSAYRQFAGFRLPTHVEAGNDFGSDDYFPFFIVDVHDVQFPSPP